jgi:hypothetical protein
MFCHQYPTGTCGWSNPTVRELPGQRSLAPGAVIDPRGEMTTASITAVGS